MSVFIICMCCMSLYIHSYICISQKTQSTSISAQSDKRNCRPPEEYVGSRIYIQGQIKLNQIEGMLKLIKAFADLQDFLQFICAFNEASAVEKLRRMNKLDIFFCHFYRGDNLCFSASSLFGKSYSHLRANSFLQEQPLKTMASTFFTAAIPARVSTPLFVNQFFFLKSHE